MGTFVSKDKTKSYYGKVVTVTPSGKIAEASPSISISGRETAADIVRRSRSIAKTYGVDSSSSLEIQKQLSEASSKQSKVVEASAKRSGGVNMPSSRSGFAFKMGGALGGLPGGGVGAVAGMPGIFGLGTKTEAEKRAAVKAAVINIPSTSLMFKSQEAAPGFSERKGFGVPEKTQLVTYKKNGKLHTGLQLVAGPIVTPKPGIKRKKSILNSAIP